MKCIAEIGYNGNIITRQINYWTTEIKTLSQVHYAKQLMH